MAVHGQTDQKSDDRGEADDVRDPSERTGRVAGVRPDQTNSRPDDEQTDHRS